MSGAPVRPDRTSARVRLAYWLALGLVVAATTHVALILALPYRARHDAFARVDALAGDTPLRTVPLPGGLAPFEDPALAGAACLYDLAAGPVHARLPVAAADVALLAVYGRHGQVLSGLTGRSATRGTLGLAVLTAAQAAATPAHEEAGAPPEIRVVTDEPRGVVVAKVLAPAPSARRQAMDEAAALACTTAPPPP